MVYVPLFAIYEPFLDTLQLLEAMSCTIIRVTFQPVAVGNSNLKRMVRYVPVFFPEFTQNFTSRIFQKSSHFIWKQLFFQVRVTLKTSFHKYLEH